MAIDTRNKRSSAINILMPWRAQLPAPDGTISQGDRQQVAFCYAGILAAAPLVVAALFQPQPNRWLLTIEGGPITQYLADAGCTILGQAYKSGIVDCQIDGITVDLDQMVATLPAATVTLSPDIDRLLDPMTDLGGRTATLSVWTYDPVQRAQVVCPLIQSRIVDLDVGVNGMPTVFQLVEELGTGKDPDFPATLVSTTETSASIVDAADGTPYMPVFGSPVAVPTKLLGPLDPAFPGNPLVVLAFQGMAADPCSDNGFPNDTYPDIGGRIPNTVIGMRFGTSPVLRDNLEKTTLASSWDVDAGSTATPSGTGVTMGAPADVGIHNMFWDGWAFSERISKRVLATFTDAAARARLFYGDDGLASPSRVRITFDNTAHTVTVEVIQAGAVISAIPTQVMPTLAAEAILTAEVNGDSLEVGINDTRLQFGSVNGLSRGRIGIGSVNGRVKFRRLRMPVNADGTGSDLNAGIYTITDNKLRPIVVQRLTGDINAELWTDFYRAGNVKDAGGLLEALVAAWGLDELEIDGPAFEEALRRLRSYGVGAYFDAQAPLTQILRDRFGRQFLTLFTQLTGIVRVFNVDPLSEPERHFTLGLEADLIDRVGSPRFVDPYSHYKAKYHWRAMNQKWRYIRFNPNVVPSLRSILDRFGRRDYPVIELPDVPDEPTAMAILLARASLTYNAYDVQYRQAMSHVINRLGRTVSITDPDIGFDQKPAILTSLQPDGADYVICGYRAFDPLPLLG